MKTVTLLVALTFVTALTQHAIAADLPHQTNSTPGLEPAGIAGECETGFCGTPSNDGGGFGGTLVSPGTVVAPQEACPTRKTTTQERAPKTAQGGPRRRTTLRVIRCARAIAEPYEKPTGGLPAPGRRRP